MLVNNLKNLGLSIWVDYAELQVGDSIVTGISNESIMDNDMAGRTQAECVLYLIDRAKNRNRLINLIRNVCHDRPDLGQP